MNNIDIGDLWKSYQKFCIMIVFEIFLRNIWIYAKPKYLLLYQLWTPFISRKSVWFWVDFGWLPAQKENKMGNIMGWGNDSLIKKKQKPHVEGKKKKKKFIHHFMPADRCQVNFWEVGCWYTWQFLQKANTITQNIPPFSFPPFLLWLGVRHTAWNIFWVSSDQVPQLSPSKPLACLQPVGLLSGGLERQPWCCASSAQQ